MRYYDDDEFYRQNQTVNVSYPPGPNYIAGPGPYPYPGFLYPPIPPNAYYKYWKHYWKCHWWRNNPYW